MGSSTKNLNTPTRDPATPPKRAFGQFWASPWADLLLGALIGFVGLIAGLQYLGVFESESSKHLSVEPRFLARAAMIASGHGSFFPDLDATPALKDFLCQRTEALAPGSLPESIPSSGDTSEAYHRYLAYSVGAVWWALGISWAAAKFYMALLFGLTMAAAYGVFRLGMGRTASLLATALYMTSPPLIDMLFDMRDFGKAPFFLGALLVMGWLLKGGGRLARILPLAALLGLVVGVGLGFRQDLIVCVPPALVVLLVCSLGEAGLGTAKRVLPAVLFLLAFCLAASPMFTRMEGGAQPYHPLVQGFSTEHRETVGLEQASYEPLALREDYYVFATVADYHKRVLPDPGPIKFNDAAAMRANRAWLLQSARTFPADPIARVYAATRWVLSSDAYHQPSGAPRCYPPAGLQPVHEAFAAHMKCFGPVYAGATLLLVAWYSPAGALGLLLLTLYFCGYVALSFQYRHAFHLAFVPLWVFAFVLEKALTGAVSLRHPRLRTDLWNLLASPRKWWVPRLAGLAAFVAVAVVLLAGPLWGARVYQARGVERLVQDYRNAALEPVPTARELLSGWMLFRPEAAWALAERGRDLLPTAFALGARSLGFPGLPEATAHFAGCYLAARSWRSVWQTETQYLAVDLVPSAQERYVLIRYEADGPVADFSHVLAIPPVQEPADGTVRYFFPAYSIVVPPETGALQPRADVQISFAGIGLPAGEGDDFQGLFRVEELGPFPLLLNFALPPTGVAPRKYQRLRRNDGRVHRLECENHSQGWLARAEAIFAEGDADEALRLFRVAVVLAPEYWQARERVVQILEDREDFAAAVATCEGALQFGPCEGAVYETLNRLLQEGFDEQARLNTWEALASRHPADRFILLYLARALHEAGQPCRSAEGYRRTAKLLPDNESLRREFLGVLVQCAQQAEEEGRSVEAIRHYKEAAEAAPPDTGLCIRLDGLLRGHAEVGARIRWWRHIAEGTPAGAPSRTFLAQALLEGGHKDEAVQLLRAQAGQNQDGSAMWADLAEAEKVAGNLEESIASYRQAIQLTPEDVSLYYGLAELFREHPGSAAILPAWREIAADNERSPLAHFHYGHALREHGYPEEAQVELREALALKEGDPIIRAELGAVLMEAAAASSTEQPEEALRFYLEAIEIQPGGFHVLSELDRLLQLLEAPAERVRQWNAIVQGQPASAKAHGHLGIALRDNGELREAVRELERAVELGGGSPAFRIELAETLSAWGDTLLIEKKRNDAIGLYMRALEVQPGNNDAYYRVDTMLGHAGDPAQRVDVWRGLAEALPEAPRVALYLGKALRAAGSAEEAVDALARAAAGLPGEAAVQAELGYACSAAKDHKGAVEAFRKVREQDSSVTHIFPQFLDSLLEIGLPKEARECWAQAKELGVSLPPGLEKKLERATSEDE